MEQEESNPKPFSSELQRRSREEVIEKFVSVSMMSLYSSVLE